MIKIFTCVVVFILANYANAGPKTPPRPTVVPPTNCRQCTTPIRSSSGQMLGSVTTTGQASTFRGPQGQFIGTGQTGGRYTVIRDAKGQISFTFPTR